VLAAVVIGQPELGLGAVIVVAAGLAIAGQAAVLPPEAAVSRPSTPVWSSYARAIAMLRRRNVVLSTVSNIFITLLLVVSGAFGPLLIVGRFEGSALLVGAALAARDLAGFAAGPAYMRLVARFGLFRWVCFSAGLGVLGIALLAAPEPAVIVLAYLLMGVAISHAVAATNLFATLGSARHERATALAATGLASRPALVALPLVLGVLLDQLGVLGLSLAAASFGFLCVVGIWMLQTQSMPAYE
jgi:hypothetical protein